MTVLTQKGGVERFNNSMDRYTKANDRYESAKSAYKQNKSSDNKIELTNSRMRKNEAKRKLTKDYKHLREDKLADKGKELYSKGKRITNTNTVNEYLATIAASPAALAVYNQETNILGSQEINKMLFGASGAGIAAVSVKRIRDRNNARKLRAYYGHTSNY